MAGMLSPSALGKTFKSASLAGFGAIGDNAKVLRGFVMQDPELLKKIGGESALDAYIKEHSALAMGTGGNYDGGMSMSADTKRIDEILSAYKMDSVGYGGMDDGRVKAITKDGNVLYTGDPYSYKPAKEMAQELMKGVAVIGATAGLSAMYNGIGGYFGSASAGTGGSTAGGAAGAAGGSGVSQAVSGLGLDAAGNLAGSSLMDGALANTFAGAGSLAPAGVGSLIPSGTALATAGGGSLLTGGMLTGGVGSAASGLTSALTAAKQGSGGIFDSVLKAGKAINSVFESSKLARSLLSLVGAGVMQMSAEKAAKKGMEFQAKERQKDRDWQDKKEADTRRRQMPAGGGMLGRARVIKGGGNGG